MAPRIAPSTFPQVSLLPQNPYKLTSRPASFNFVNSKPNFSTADSTSSLLNNSILKSVYDLGSWADRNLNFSSVKLAQTTLGTVGGYANIQQDFNQESVNKYSNKSSISSIETDSVKTLQPYTLKPSLTFKILNGLGRGLDAITGAIGLCQAFKSDVDSNNNSLSGTLNVTIKSAGQISLASATGVVVAGMIGVGMTPIAIGAAAGVAAGYGAGYLYDKTTDWLF